VLPRLSIITPVKNSEATIESCIQNVLGQKCPDIEHVILDGMSNDRTCDIVRSFAARNPGIRLFSEPDRNQSHAMNKGIALARAPLIGMINADDYYEPGVLNRVLALAETLPADSFLVANCYIHTAGSDKKLFRPGHLRYEALLLGPRWNVHPCNPTMYFYHKSIHEKVGGYDERFTYNMDLDFIIRASRVWHVRYYDEVWGNFVIHSRCKTYHSSNSGRMIALDRDVLLKNISDIPGFRRLYFRARYEIMYMIRDGLFILRSRLAIKSRVRKILGKLKSLRGIPGKE
jgi:glycosyltransferase involved in cell wall biosynthesis